jgi:hypothetical protein
MSRPRPLWRRWLRWTLVLTGVSAAVTAARRRQFASNARRYAGAPAGAGDTET